MSVVSRLVLIGVCLIVAMASGAAFLNEYRVAYLLRGTANDQIDALSASDAPLRSFSARSSRDLLSACGRLMTTAPRIKAEPATSVSVRRTCGRIAQDILSRAPTNARAMAVALVADLPNLSPDTFAKAQKAAPMEPWPLLMRLETIKAATDTNSIHALALQDIRQALQSDWGRDRVAQLYLQRPDVQDVVIAALDQRPAADQRAFMSALRRASRDAN
jgi:hypothetical protein